MKKKGCFFELPDDREDIVRSDIADNSEHNSSINGTDISDTEISVADDARSDPRRQILIISVCVVLLLTVFFLVRHIYNSDTISGSVYYPEYWLTPKNDGKTYKLYIYPPDWESDILNDESYLQLKGDIIYAPNDSQSVAVNEGNYLSVGGKGLQFMAGYVDAVIRGDHEALNAMFTDKYFEDHKPYSDFPEQRLFNIKIKKYAYHDTAFDNTQINDGYYIITYKIDRNDGLFRDDIDGYSELAQLFELLIYPDGTVKIDNVISLPGYFN